MIQLKFKQNVGDVSDQLRPYYDKVIFNLNKTDVDKHLVTMIEEAIRNKTYVDVEELCDSHNFDIFKNMYMNIARHIIDNLKTNNQISNIELINRVNNGEITAAQLVNLTPEEMHKSRWSSLIKKKELDAKKITSDPEATSELFWCNRCHRNKTHYFERQDRSADEPMTIHITCCYCGHRWRQ
jgi:transcription elongation factor S-II